MAFLDVRGTLNGHHKIRHEVCKLTLFPSNLLNVTETADTKNKQISVGDLLERRKRLKMRRIVQFKEHILGQNSDCYYAHVWMHSSTNERNVQNC